MNRADLPRRVRKESETDGCAPHTKSWLKSTLITRETIITFGEIHRVLEKAGPEASRIFLAEFTGRDDLSVPELLLEALSRLPSTGSIRGKRDVFAVKCVGWLKNDLTDADPRKDEINQQWDEIQRRLPATISGRLV